MPTGIFLDAQGNLYVGDEGASNVKEYAPGSASPTFTYNAGMMYPADVSVDRAGNVFEADSAGGPITDGFINEYAQGSNTVVHTCNTGVGGVTGVAVDRKGDVFVDVVSQIIEFKGGLNGCSVTLLASLNLGGGLALDKNNNIVVADTGNQTVDIIAPPYQMVTKTFGSFRFNGPQSVRLNRANTLAFVSDVGLESHGQVLVLQYPGCALVTVAGSGIRSPVSAVEGPNAVF